MTDHPTKSFAEVCVLEAVARRLRVDLVLKPVSHGGDRRLSSRFLGVEDRDLLVLATPQAVGGARVFVPADWDVGMGFKLGNLWVQGRTTVQGHCMHQLRPARRVDALLVQRPDRVFSRTARKSPRYAFDPSEPVMASIWFTDELHETADKPPETGRLIDFSEGGLGIRLCSPVVDQVGSRAIIRFALRGAGESLIFRGVLKHCTPRGDDGWQAGFGEVVNIRPGQAVGVAEFLALHNT